MPHGLITEEATLLWVGVARHDLAVFLVVLNLGTSSLLQFLGCLVQPSQDALVTVIPEPFINGSDSFGHPLQVINGPCG